MDFVMDDVPLVDLRDDGLTANQCYPKMLVDDPTFALLNEDNYFLRHGRTPYDFAVAPSQQIINGQTQPYHKRDLGEQDHLAWDDGNSSRPLTRPELEHFIDYLSWQKQQEEREKLVYVECIGDSCATEVKPLARYVLESIDQSSEEYVLMLLGKLCCQSHNHSWHRQRQMRLPHLKSMLQTDQMRTPLQRQIDHG